MNIRYRIAACVLLLGVGGFCIAVGGRIKVTATKSVPEARKTAGEKSTETEEKTAETGITLPVLLASADAGVWQCLAAGENAAEADNSLPDKAAQSETGDDFLYGDAAAAVIDDYVTRYATVAANRLNVRSKADIGADRVGYLDRGERVKLIEDTGDWLEVEYAVGMTGYVAAQYVTVSEEFLYAKTPEEEAAELAERQILEARREEPEEESAEDTAVETAENAAQEVEAPAVPVSDGKEALRQQIVDYAMQYLGNRYIHGGQTLAGGTDCSGFTSLIYADFGYSISRTPAGQLSGAGHAVDYSAARPGDIICYGSGGRCTHVALYIGNEQIIHEANSRKGVIIGQADYDTILGVRDVID